MNDHIYIPCLFTNGVLRLDTKTDKADIIKIGSENMSYFGIAYHNEKIYISINDGGNGIIKWNVNDNECEIITGSEHLKFRNLYVSEGKLIASGINNEPFYEYSLSSHKLLEKNMKYSDGILPNSLEYRKYFKYKNNNFYVSSRTGCIHNSSDDKAVIKIECAKSYDNMAHLDQKISNYLNESSPCSLLDFLKITDKYVTNKIDFEYTIDIKTNCGEAIHNKVKESV